MTKEFYLKPTIRIRPFVTGDEILQDSFPIGGNDDTLEDDPWAKETDLDYDVEIKSVWSE